MIRPDEEHFCVDIASSKQEHYSVRLYFFIAAQIAQVAWSI